MERFHKRQVSLSKLACVELKRIVDDLREADDGFDLPEQRPGFGEIVYVNVPSTSIVALLAHPEIAGAQ